LRELLKEPLLHFLVLGALLCGAYAWSHGGRVAEVGRIVVTRGEIDGLQTSFARLWQRPPTASELDGLVKGYVREEVLASEATRLGLDVDDPVIRRRLRQKMEFVADDLAAPPDPTDADLNRFMTEHPDLFRAEPRLTVRQVYLDAGRRGDTLRLDAARLLEELNRPKTATDFRALGDATMLDAELVDVPLGDVVRQFGEDFARQVERLPTGKWQGPVTSAYGEHLVLVSERKPERMPELAEVREKAVRQWTDTKRREANERFYQELLARYVVEIEGEPTGGHGNALAADPE